jgi:hypothetical protein
MNKLKKTLIIVFLIIGILVVVFFATRNFFLQQIISKVSVRLEEDYHTGLSLKEAKFSGVNTIFIREIALLPHPGDTLIKIDSVFVRPAFFPLLTGRIKLSEAFIKNFTLDISCTNDLCNYDFLFHRRSPVQSQKRVEKNYALQLNKLMNMLFDLSPQKADFENMLIKITRDDSHEQIIIPFFHSTEKTMEGLLLSGKDSSRWRLSGNFSQNERMIDVKIFPGTDEKPSVPLLNLLAGATVKFDTIHLALQRFSYNRPGAVLAGIFSADGLEIAHRKISDEPVGLRSFDFNFILNVGKDFAELDSSSSCKLDSLKVIPYVHYENNASSKYSLKLRTEKTAADNFLFSLPQGMFDAVSGVEAEGTLQYSLDFFLDSSHPDSLIFNSSLVKEKFRMKKFGKENLLKLNEEFLYSVYEHEQFIRSFMVGPSNPDFTPLGRISPSFRNAVMTSEDGSFFYHNGFNEDAFRKSIAANYKAGKFVRGGSTITMQLVKNVFLTRHKTISRKAEEALIVWLIENNRLCSKERMLEVYLNIIELGPDIYGIGEASRFYFSKKPDELTLAESVFLASLLPHPKWFKYSFDENGNLKPYFADYYRVVANFLLRKNLITQAEYDQLQPRVELKGRAKNLVTPSDILPDKETESEGGY